MERMGSRRAGQENGDGTTAGRAGAVRVRATATVAVTVAAVAALAGCSVTVQPKNAAASRPLSSSPTPSGVSSSAPSTSAASSSATPTPTPTDVDHAACTNVRDALETLNKKLVTDKDSASRSAQDFRNAGYALRTQGNKTKNSDLKSALKTVSSDYLTVGSDAANHESTTTDLGKASEDSKPLSTLCGGGSSGSTSSSGGASSSASGSSTASSN
jgi:hypothetical protein